MRLFVYGTLRRGECNEFFLWRAHFIGEAEALDHRKLPEALRGPPKMVPELGARAPGEVYEVSESRMYVLDQMELGAGYERVEIQTTLGPAVAYVWEHPQCVACGEWPDSAFYHFCPSL